VITRRRFSQILIATACLFDADYTGIAQSASLAEQPGPLDQPTLDVLMATAEAVTRTQPLQGHYAAYYCYQSLRRPNHRRIYQLFADEIRRATTRTKGAFISQSTTERLEIVNAVRFRSAFAGQFESPIFQETLAVFMKTDAWIRLGYAGWPGSPRGLDSYQCPFGSSECTR
jgi:hypothetical protein